MNRPDLMALLGQRVTITHPSGSTEWTGKLIAVGQEPCAVIDQDYGPRLCLPQSYAIAPAEALPEPAPLAPWEEELLDQQAASIHREDTLAARLDRMLANLTAHIEQRAAEVAQPLIAKAQVDACDDIERAQHKQQRAEDLVAELRRRIGVLERYNQSYQGRAAAIRSLHRPVGSPPTCEACTPLTALRDPSKLRPHPCATIRALDGLPLLTGEETGRLVEESESPRS